jgi:hypothetical protein
VNIAKSLSIAVGFREGKLASLFSHLSEDLNSTRVCFSNFMISDMR